LRGDDVDRHRYACASPHVRPAGGHLSSLDVRAMPHRWVPKKAQFLRLDPQDFTDDRDHAKQVVDNVESDAFAYTPGARNPQSSREPGRYGGSRIVGENNENGTVVWQALVRRSTADQVAGNIETLLVQAEDAGTDFRRRTAGRGRAPRHGLRARDGSDGRH
jgi:hypothetical protein